jgi:hypothetical protein
MTAGTSTMRTMVASTTTATARPEGGHGDEVAERHEDPEAHAHPDQGGEDRQAHSHHRPEREEHDHDRPMTATTARSQPASTRRRWS